MLTLEGAAGVRDLLADHDSPRRRLRRADLAREAGRPMGPMFLERNEPTVVLYAEWLNGAEPTTFVQAHLPGARLLDTDRFEDGYPTWKLRSSRQLQRTLYARGVEPTTRVLVHGADFAAACRVAWVLHFCGVRHVHLASAGWRTEQPVESGAGPASKVRPRRRGVGHDVVWRDAVFASARVTTAGVLAALRDARSCLVDVRSHDEFVGAKSGYDYLDRTGRIPGAVNAPITAWQPLLQRHDFAALRDAWSRSGIPLDDAKRLVFYCGSGWRSSVAYLAAWCLGLRNITNYSDGWCGWSTRYSPDANAGGSTPGWRQTPSARPVESRSASIADG